MNIYDEIKGLNGTEFEDLLTWMVSSERDRRKTTEAEVKAQIEQIQALRDNGVLTTPVEGADYEVGQVYLPQETAWADGVKYEVTSSLPTSALPFDSSDWTETSQ